MICNRVYILVCALLILVSGFSEPTYAAQKDVKEMSLKEAVMLALRFNPNVKQTYLERITQKYSLQNSLHDYELRYSLSGSVDNLYSNSRVAGVNQGGQSRSYSVTPGAEWHGSLGTSVRMSSSNSFGNGTKYSPGVGLSISQPLFRGFSKIVNLHGWYSAYENEEINKISLRSAISNVIQEVITVYRELISKNDTIKSAQRSLEDAQKRLITQEEMVKAGRYPPNSVLSFKFQCEDAKLNVEKAKKDVDDAKLKLLITVGLEANIDIKIPDHVDVKVLQVPDANKTISLALTKNPEYLSSLISLKSIKRNVIIAKDTAKWDVRVNATANVGGGQVGMDSMLQGKDHNENVGLSVTVPIDRLPVKTAIINAKIALKRKEIDLETQKRNLIINVKKQIYNIKNQIDQIKAAERALILAQQTYKQEVKKQELGRSMAVEVKSASDSLKEAERRVMEAKIGYLTAMDLLYRTTDTFLEEWGVEIKF